ncbi:GWxTD domain-containing protein, partial [candidate division KSB1 bacterium]
IDGAIAMFDKARKKDRDFAEANYELGKLYVLQGTATSIPRAETAFKNAIRSNPGNVQYLMALAKYYDFRKMNYQAIEAWKKVVNTEPDNMIGLENLARAVMIERAAIRYRLNTATSSISDNLMATENLDLPDDVSTYFWDENIFDYYLNYHVTDLTFGILCIMKRRQPKAIRYSLYSSEYDSLAVNCFNKILEINPKNRDALYNLGLIYFESITFRDQMKSSGLKLAGYRPDYSKLHLFTGLFENVIRDNPDDKDGNLFLGLAFTRLRKYDKAYKHFMAAGSLMDEEERRIFANIDILKTGGLARSKSNILASDSLTFWIRRDPLYITPYNERELEHYSRIAEANLRWSIPARSIEGWKTLKGKMLIKYGTPENRAQQGYARDDDEAIRSWDFWHYDNFAFVFERNFGESKEIHRFGYFSGMDFSEIITDVEKKFPEYYEYKPRGRVIDLPVDVVRFRGSSDDTDVNLYFGAHLRDIGMTREQNVLKGTLQQGMFLFDEDWNRLTSRIDTVGLEYDPAEYDTSAAGFTTITRSFSLPEGRYNLAVELVDPVSGNTGTFRGSLTIEPFGYGSLQMSDLLIANNIELLDARRAPSRANISVLGNPFHSFRKDQPVHLYFEIYNLLLSAANDRSSYRIEYALYPARERGLLERIFMRRQGDEGVSVTSDITGTGRSDNRVLAVEHGITQPGDYLLTVRITDKTTGQSTERTTYITIY